MGFALKMLDKDIFVLLCKFLAKFTVEILDHFELFDEVGY